MQRRAVALYVAIFLLVIVAAGALIATAESPAVSIDDPEFELAEGQEFEIDGVTYTVTSLTEGEDDADFDATVEWNETDVEQTEPWDNETVVEYRGGEWAVVIDGGDEPTGLTLEELIDRQAILEDDPNAQNETIEDADGNEFVIVVDEDGQEDLVPVEEYFPAPETEAFVEGDTIDLDDDRTVTIDEIDETGVTVSWIGDVTESLDLAHEGTAELGGTEYLVWFTGQETVMLSTDFESYEAQIETIGQFDNQLTGLWYTIIVSGMIVLLLPMVAFLPSRY